MKTNLKDFINESTLPFDNEIISELEKLYKNTIFDKTNTIDSRINQLLSLHSKWLENAKKIYSAEEIAKKLFKYEKDLGNIKENKITEMHQGDVDQLIFMSAVIRKFIPDFDVIIQGYYGEIKYDGIVHFTTHGPSTDNVILAYVSGLMKGLMYKKK